MSSICRSCTAMHPCHGIFFTPVELFGTHIQVARSSLSAPIDSHVQHQEGWNVHTHHCTLVKGCCPLSVNCVITNIRISNLKKTPGTYRDIQHALSPRAACVRVCLAHLQTWTHGRLHYHNYSTSVIPYMHQSAPEIAGTICMFTCFPSNLSPDCMPWL